VALDIDMPVEPDPADAPFRIDEGLGRQRLVQIVEQLPPDDAEPAHRPRVQVGQQRGDGHYGCPEVMAFCEAEGIDYVFGLPTNAVLRAAVEDAADDVRVRRAEESSGAAPLCRDALRHQVLG